eukprot:TRINITY_DN39600_c0_g4_i1.p1 TRINITY_DN39600_c0_g4~~TRINITY_DN39600_c0_g4_i1.p1  ORF type:complete len:158 (-),score=26.71 TRINITY_DN39600_c0_g4_i1:419-892(-)
MEKGCHWQGALALQRRLGGAGLSATYITCSATISACEKGEQWKHAVCLLQRMATNAIEKGIITYNAMASACSKGLIWRTSFHVLSKGEAGGLNIDAIGGSDAVLASVTSGAWAEALEAFDMLQERRLEADVELTSAVLMESEQRFLEGQEAALLKHL